MKIKMSESTVIHAIILGDDMVGKTSLANCKLNNVFNEEYQPTVFENFEIQHKMGSEEFTVSLFDTAGLQNHRNLRSFVYERCHVIIMCFSICDKNSYRNVVENWMPEVVAETKGKLPIVLVGMQADTRGIVYPELEVPHCDGFKLSKDIGADTYLECSASTNEGINTVFHHVVNSALRFRKKSGSFFKRILGR